MLDGVRPWHLLVLTLVLRLFMFLLVGSWDAAVERDVILTSDAQLYHVLGSHLASTGTFMADPVRTPAYTCYIAAFYAVGGVHPWIVIASQLVLDAFIACLCFVFASSLLGRRAGAVAGILYAFDPSANLSANMLMSDTLFTFFLVGASILALRAWAPHGSPIAARKPPAGGSGLPMQLLAALLLGLATLTRPVALYFVPMYAVIVLRQYRGAILNGLARVAGMSAVFLLVLTPWVLRNVQEYGVVGISSSGALNMLFLYAVPAESLHSGVSAVQAVRNIEVWGGVSPELFRDGRRNLYEQHLEIGRLGRQYLLAHPTDLVRATLLGMAQMFVGSGSGGYSTLIGTGTGITDLKDAVAEHGLLQGLRMMVAEKGRLEKGVMVLNTAIHIVQYLLVLAGLWALRGRALRGAFLPLLIFLVLYSAIIGAAGVIRFKVPMVPFYLVYAGAGATAIIDLVNARRRAKRGAAHAPDGAGA